MIRIDGPLTAIDRHARATSPDPNYAQTRRFYERLGFAPLDVFPTLWSPRNPCLQMVKVLD